jgi:hypothetical protein
VAPDSWGALAGSGLYAGVVDGFSGNTQDTTSFYIGVTLKTGVEGLSFGAAYDYREDGNNGLQPGDNWANAMAGYLTFRATEHLSFAGRVDYTTGSNGTWYNSIEGENQLLSATLTADYKLWANVLARFEFRWDTCLTDDTPYGGDSLYGGPSDENALTVAANLVYKF